MPRPAPWHCGHRPLEALPEERGQGQAVQLGAVRQLHDGGGEQAGDGGKWEGVSLGWTGDSLVEIHIAQLT